MEILSFSEKSDISLYFHIPFCTKKCPYCHFFVVQDQARFHEPFVEALLREIALRRPELEGKRIVSVYFGGGTPTKLPPNAYLSLLQQLQLSPDCEVTLEANPEDVTLSCMQAYREAGINRVSIGVQSLLEEELLTLGRTHSASRAQNAIWATYNAGITNISIDLMCELPHQTLASWEKSLSALVDLPIAHLSLYNLTIEPHTSFFKRQHVLALTIAEEPEKLAMLQKAVVAFEKIGLKRYEISAFARDGCYSRHNTGYWTGRSFLGFGPSAFSYWEGERFSNVAHYNKYLEDISQGQVPVAFREKLIFPNNLKELLAVQLRLVQGVNLPSFEERYGILPSELVQTIEILQERKWLTRSGSTIALTPEGQLFYDSVAVELI